MPDVQAKRKIHKGNDCASRELREETSGAGIGKILYVARTKKRNLISLCHDCHEEVHGYRKKEEKKPLTEERWD